MIRIIRLLGNFNGNKNTTEMGAMSTPLTFTNNRKKEQMNYQTAREREREKERETGGWRLLVVSLSLRSDPMRVLLLTLLVCLASSCLGDDTVRWSSTSSL